MHAGEVLKFEKALTLGEDGRQPACCFERHKMCTKWRAAGLAWRLHVEQMSHDADSLKPERGLVHQLQQKGGKPNSCGKHNFFRSDSILPS